MSDWNIIIFDIGVDFKYIDSNGDGVIDVLDIMVISFNWGRVVNLMFNFLEEYCFFLSVFKIIGVLIFIEVFLV